MGNPVTVDSDDLEKIIMLTGIAKQFEQLLYQRKSDPFISKDIVAIKDAHDRISAEWRRSTRQLHPDYDIPPTDKAYTLACSLAGRITQIDHVSMKNKLFSELFKKGYIEYGNAHEVIYWADSHEQQRVNEVAEVMVRLTQRGIKMLNAMDTKGNRSIQ